MTRPAGAPAGGAIGLIPARGGSRSIPLKNLVPIAGRPLISYAIAAARAARSLNGIVCSTEHPGIAAVCASAGVDVIPRPEDLCGDDTPVADVVRHVLDALRAGDGIVPSMVALLQPTSPFILPSHIDACVAALDARPDADSAQTVTQVPHNAHAFNQRVVEDGLVRFRFLEERRAAYNKQRKPKHFVFGNLIVTRSTALMAGKDCFGDVSVPIEIPRTYALDVDTAEDVDLASFLVESGRFAPSW